MAPPDDLDERLKGIENRRERFYGYEYDPPKPSGAGHWFISHKVTGTGQGGLLIVLRLNAQRWQLRQLVAAVLFQFFTASGPG